MAGLLVGGALRREPHEGGTLYLASPAGSAAGCLAFVALITALGAAGLLQALFLSAAVPVLMLWRLAAKRCAASLAGIALATAILALLPIQPDRDKRYWSFPGEPVEFGEWNPISRIDVISSSRMPMKKFITIDGDAWAPLFMLPPPSFTGHLDTPHREALYAAAELSRLLDPARIRPCSSAFHRRIRWS